MAMLTTVIMWYIISLVLIYLITGSSCGSGYSIEDHFFTFVDAKLCTFVNIPTPESPSVQYMSISGTSSGGQVMKDVWPQLMLCL